MSNLIIYIFGYLRIVFGELDCNFLKTLIPFEAKPTASIGLYHLVASLIFVSRVTQLLQGTRQVL